LGGQPDRVPLAELKVDVEVKESFLGKAVRDVKTDVEFWVKAGYDYIRLRANYDFHQRASTIRRFGYAVYGGEQERRWAAQGKGVITSIEEFEKFPFPKLKDIDFSPLEEVGEYLPGGMKVIAGVTGIWEAVWMLMGFESFSYALVENPELVEIMFSRVGKIMWEIFYYEISFPWVAGVWYSDDIAYSEGLMISPKILRRFLFPWIRKMVQVCRERGLPFIYHSDGKLWDVMPDLMEIGINALHPIEPKAMDIREVKKKFGNKLCLIGNIDLGYTLTRGTPQEVEEEVKQRLREIAPGGSYCMGSSNTITHYVPLGNYRAMIETTLKYGCYPISV